MNSASSSPTDLQLASLTLGSPQRVNDPYDYDSQARSPYHFQTSPSVIPGQSPIAHMNIPQTPLKPAKPARAGLPSQWLDNQPSTLSEGRSLSPYHTSDLSSGGGSSPPPVNGFSNPAFQSPPSLQPLADDDVIPNAIVIKNIPFNVKRETLLDIITSLNIPTPYAFNYHLDPAGAFRGLAFANFRAPEDADAVVVALNGFDVQGRKLRVEYKKVLQAGEKERIEREKALRRMRSMQMEREKQHQQYDDFSSPIAGGGMYSPPQSYTPTSTMQASLFPQHGSSPALQAMQSPFNTPVQAQPATPKPSSSPPELDMNDPATLEIYSRILLFKDDPMRDELAFSRTLSPKQRRVVHLIAQKMGVYHYSVGEGEERYAVVTRIDPETRQQPRTPQRHTSQTLSRASSSYLQQSNAGTTAFNTGTLRSKKSMPDMKTLHTSAPRLTVRSSNTNLREGFHTIASPSRRQPGGFGALFGNGGGAFGGVSEGGIPPVPTLPAGLTSNGMNDGPTHGIMRQPRGPNGPSESGFILRRTSGVSLNVMDQNAGAPGLEARSHEPLEL